MLHKMNPVRIQFIREKLVSRDASLCIYHLLPSVYQWQILTNAKLQTEIMREESDDSVDESKTLQGLDVLDVGCGGGLLCEVCSSSTKRAGCGPNRHSSDLDTPGLEYHWH